MAIIVISLANAKCITLSCRINFGISYLVSEILKQPDSYRVQDLTPLSHPPKDGLVLSPLVRGRSFFIIIMELLTNPVSIGQGDTTNIIK